jgi:GT2 family glycosyltransferase
MIINLKAGFRPRTNRLFRLAAKLRSLRKRKLQSYRDIPVIINNFNRLDYMEQLISWLEKARMKRIYIIDNNSTYPPLLDYYKKTKYTIFKLDKNIGHTALWDTHIFMWFKNSYYIYTDPDILPIEECPLNAVDYFLQILKRYPEFTKVGFGLKIDDIPDFYSRKKEVLRWESKYWEEPIAEGLYKARIDTTFALYRPNIRNQQWDRTLRTSDIYISRHLPWYEDDNKPSEEDIFFRKVTTTVSSWYKEVEYNG